MTIKPTVHNYRLGHVDSVVEFVWYGIKDRGFVKNGRM